LSNYGKEKKYFKINGPTIVYKKPKIDNLRLRSNHSTKGKIIRNLNKKDKLLILKKGKEETLGKVKGRWVKVLTDKNEIGWCFDYYLEPI